MEIQQQRRRLVDRDPHLVHALDGQLEASGYARDHSPQNVDGAGISRHGDDDGAQRLDHKGAYTSRAPEPGGPPTGQRDEGVAVIELEIENRQQDGWTVLVAGGELDLYTAPRLRDEVLSTLEGGATKIALDLHDVGFIDSTGLGILVACLKRVRERDGRLVVIAPETSPLRRLLTLTGLEEALPTHAALADVADE